MVRVLFSKWGLIALAMVTAFVMLLNRPGSKQALGSLYIPQPVQQKVVVPQVKVDNFFKISPRIPGLKFTQFTGQFGKEGKPPSPNGPNRILQIYTAEQFFEKSAGRYVELRDELGTVVARMSWELKDVTLLFPDYKGPVSGSWIGRLYAWVPSLEVAPQYEQFGIGSWLWRFSERIFAQPGDVVMVVDVSRTSIGLTGWTSAQFPGFMQFVETTIQPVTMILTDPVYNIWIYQYPDVFKPLTGGN